MADSSTIKLTGLSEARKNLENLKDGAARYAITREALLAGALVINRTVKAATYTTFNRRTGQIGGHWGVRIAQDFKDEQLNAVIVQYPTAAASGVLIKSARRRTVAFWWRFLEYGTHGRRTARTTKAARISRLNRKLSARSQRALDRYNVARSLGDLSPRPWVEPAMQASAAAAVDEFRQTYIKATDAAVKSFPL